MTSEAIPRLAWVQPFLDALGDGQTIVAAAGMQGIHPTTAYYRRKHDAGFAEAWRAAVAAPDEAGPGAERTPARGPHWRKCFLEALAETSNVTAAATRANTPVATVYRERRTDRGFAVKWLAALQEGYDHLEMELLGYLHDSQPQRKMDVAAALRLLAAHRETVERRRALMGEEEDEQEILESLDRFLEDMHQRRIANTAILIETDVGDGAE